MPLLRLDIPGGVVTDTTDYAESPKWRMSDRVRFINGRPRTIAGWQRNTTYTLTGVTKQILGWKMITSDRTCIAYATNKKLQLAYDGVLYDITPIRATVNPMANNPFATVNGDATITVTEASHGAVAGDYVIFSGASTFNSVNMNGEWVIATVVNANSYTIEYTGNASGTGSGGGAAVVAQYLLSTGTSTAVPGLGWGTGSWSGNFGWGSPSSGGGVTVEEAIWSLDLWGEDLVATRCDGGIYVWDSSVGPSTRAAVMSGAPARNRFAFVAMPTRHMVSFGCTSSGGTFDPMLVRWSISEDYTNWTSSATNDAGAQRLQVGTKLIGAFRTRNNFLVFTDQAAYQMYFQGPPFTFGFKPLGMRCSPIGQYAGVDVNGIVYWMADQRFFLYNGAIQIIPCPVQRYVFERINLFTKTNVVAQYNSTWNEVTWYYASTDADYPDSAVTLNILTGEWSLHSFGRTAGQDRGGILGAPIATDENGNVYAHETGTTADGSPLNPYIETGEFELSTAEAPFGTRQFLIDKLIMDAELSGEMEVTMYTRKYPLASQTTKGPYTVTTSSGKISTRVRGRQLKLRFESTGTGDSWMLGATRVNAILDSPR